MDKITIQGGPALKGTVKVSGSKNGALAIMAGAILADDEVILHNVPRIQDTLTMVELLNGLGAPTRFDGPSTVVINPKPIHKLEAPYELVRKMRASFCVLGPLLAKYGFARVPVPGGCDIGARPVNFHIDGLKRLGAQLHVEHGVYSAEADKLAGAHIYFDFPSAGATQHLMTAACLAKGTTTIENCAAEPEVVDLARFLNSLGGRVSGMGSTTITIEGVERIHGGEYSILPDRMEAGTLAIAGAITQGDIRVQGAVCDHLGPVLRKLEEAGILAVPDQDGFRVKADGRAHAVDIKTMPHPAFPTDLQQPFAALLATADGTSVITENVYESRFRYVNELNRMGADIRVAGRQAVITGVNKLAGAPVTATDLRAGAALVCAALGAEGATEIVGVEHLDRGYQGLVDKLSDLGAEIVRRPIEELGEPQPCLA